MGFERVRFERRVCAAGRSLDSARWIARSSVARREGRRVGGVCASGGRVGSIWGAVEEEAADSGSKRAVRTAVSLGVRSTVVIAAGCLCEVDKEWMYMALASSELYGV